MTTYEDKINRAILIIVLLMVLCFGIFLGCGLYLTAVTLVAGFIAGLLTGCCAALLMIEKRKYDEANFKKMS